MPLPAWTQEQADTRRLIFTPARTREELWGWIYTFLNVDLPGTIVYERQDGLGSNTTPLDMAWAIYQRLMYPTGNEEQDVAEMLFYASRFGGKTLTMAIIEVLALLHMRTDAVHLAATEQQSGDAQRYLKKFFDESDELRGFKQGDNVRETVAIYYVSRDDGRMVLNTDEYERLTLEEQRGYRRHLYRAEVIVATMQSVNGKHSGLLCLDELDVLRDPRVFAESKNIPTPIRRDDGSFVDPLTVMTSTRKTAFGPVQKAIDAAKETGLVVRHWNILEATQACPATRHRPDLPMLPVYRSDETLRTIDPATYEALSPREKERYVGDQAYHGCVNNCRIFAACGGRLATKTQVDNEFLKPLTDTAKKFRSNTLDGARSQLMCLKPSSVGLIYGHLLQDHHLISPARCYEMVFGQPPPQGPRMTKAELIEVIQKTDAEFGGGQDYGKAHDFAFVAGFKFGQRAFVLRAPAAPDLDPDQQLLYSEPLRHMDLRAIYGDIAYPGTISFFKRNGWRMKDWVKGPGTVLEGILIVKHMLAPLDGDPLVHFVFEPAGDDEMGELIQKLREWAWKLDAGGKPTNIPVNDGKDLPDALRYWLMNTFPLKGGHRAMMADNPQVGVPQKAVEPAAGMVGQSDFMRGIINQLTGGSAPVVRQPGGRGKGRLKFV